MKNIFLPLLFSILIACSPSPQKQDTSSIARNEKLYIVNIDDTPKEDFINLSSFFQGVKTIILETNEDCLIGVVNSIKILDDYIVVMDSESTENILVFDKDGHFLHKIGKTGQGPGEYIDITDSSIDFEKKEIYLFDFPTNNIHKYDIASGKYINSVNIGNDDFKSYFIQYVNGKIYTSTIPFSETDDSFLLQELDANTGRLVASYLNTTEYNKGWNNFFTRQDGFFYPNEKGESKYVQMFMDTVISIADDGIRPYLAIKSKNWITQKDIHDLIEYKTENEGMLSNKILFERNISYNIHQYFEGGNIIYFQYQNNGNTESVIYNTETHTTKIADILKDDIVYIGDKFILPSFVYADKKGAYSYLKTNQISQLLEIISTGGINPDLDKLSRLSKLPEDSNPVIFYYKFKN
jgi:hypothetical protein